MPTIEPQIIEADQYIARMLQVRMLKQQIRELEAELRRAETLASASQAVKEFREELRAIELHVAETGRANAVKLGYAGARRLALTYRLRAEEEAKARKDRKLKYISVYHKRAK